MVEARTQAVQGVNEPCPVPRSFRRLTAGPQFRCTKGGVRFAQPGLATSSNIVPHRGLGRPVLACRRFAGFAGYSQHRADPTSVSVAVVGSARGGTTTERLAEYGSHPLLRKRFARAQWSDLLQKCSLDTAKLLRWTVGSPPLGKPKARCASATLTGDALVVFQGLFPLLEALEYESTVSDLEVTVLRIDNNAAELEARYVLTQTMPDLGTSVAQYRVRYSLAPADEQWRTFQRSRGISEWPWGIAISLWAESSEGEP